MIQTRKIFKDLAGFVFSGRQGTFWQEKSFDRIIRNDKELQNIINYTIQNPVKAGIVENRQDFPYSYLDVSSVLHGLRKRFFLPIFAPKKIWTIARKIYAKPSTL
ncbi:MAG: hypothetical protein EAZ95_13960 [Bacteroidetes bacterium]|nr:MAG: hypothetical protein EAZ95_13960 [Bacteroidota bacterium]